MLRAELPHLWPHIEKLRGQKSEYSERALSAILGRQGAAVIPDLISIGLLSETRSSGGSSYKIPFLFRDWLEVTQGRMT